MIATVVRRRDGGSEGGAVSRYRGGAVGAKSAHGPCSVLQDCTAAIDVRTPPHMQTSIIRRCRICGASLHEHEQSPFQEAKFHRIYTPSDYRGEFNTQTSCNLCTLTANNAACCINGRLHLVSSHEKAYRICTACWLSTSST